MIGNFSWSQRSSPQVAVVCDVVLTLRDALSIGVRVWLARRRVKVVHLQVEERSMVNDLGVRLHAAVHGPPLTRRVVVNRPPVIVAVVGIPPGSALAKSSAPRRTSGADEGQVCKRRARLRAPRLPRDFWCHAGTIHRLLRACLRAGILGMRQWARKVERHERRAVVVGAARALELHRDPKLVRASVGPRVGQVDLRKLAHDHVHVRVAWDVLCCVGELKIVAEPSTFGPCSRLAHVAKANHGCALPLGTQTTQVVEQLEPLREVEPCRGRRAAFMYVLREELIFDVTSIARQG